MRQDQNNGKDRRVFLTDEMFRLQTKESLEFYPTKLKSENFKTKAGPSQPKCWCQEVDLTG